MRAETGIKHQIIAAACSVDHARQVRAIYEECGYAAGEIHRDVRRRARTRPREVARRHARGQRAAEGERAAVRQIAPLVRLPLTEITVDLAPLGAGLLAGDAPSRHAAHPEWWPFRNQLLVTLAGAWALKNDCDRVLVGSVVTDDRHVDGTAEFYDRLDQLTAMQEDGLHVAAPAVAMRAEELLAAADVEDEVLSGTRSCHTGRFACGTCGGCVKRTAVLRAEGRLTA